MIEYSFTRIELLKDKTDNIIGLVIGMSAIDTETNANAYIDTVHKLETPVASLTNDEIRNICLQVAQDNNWYSILHNNIESSKNEPTRIPISDI